MIGAGGGSASNPAAIECVRARPDEAHARSWASTRTTRATRSALRSRRDRTAGGDPLVVAIGETGLDYHYDNSPRAAQIESLRAHVAIAARLGRPLVIHCRDAYDDLQRVLREESSSAPRGVVHCFTGTAAEARLMLDLGFALSFSGIVTFKSADSLREAARVVPAERLLVETDAPFHSRPFPCGARCEPGFVVRDGAVPRGLARRRSGGALRGDGREHPPVPFGRPRSADEGATLATIGRAARPARRVQPAVRMPDPAPPALTRRCGRRHQLEGSPPRARTRPMIPSRRGRHRLRALPRRRSRR